MSKPIIECPINYFENNLYFNAARSCWAAYKLKGFNYDFQSNSTQLNILVNLAQTIKNVAHAKIMIVPTTEDVELHYSRLKKKIRPKDVLYEAATLHAEQTCDYLKKAGQEYWNDYTTYLIVKLQDEAVDEIELAGKQILEFMRSPIYSLTSLLLLNPEDITTVAYKKFTALEQEVYQTLNACVELLPLTSAETQWLLKRTGYKGLKQPVKLNKVLVTTTDERTGEVKKEYTEDWTPYIEKGKQREVEYYRPHKNDVANMFAGRLKCEGNKGISITHDDGAVSYQSYLVLTNVPEAIDFPGKEWIYQLQKQPMQIEVCIDIENVHYKKAEEALNLKQTEVNTQVENIQKANAMIPSKLREATAQIESLKRELGDNKLPMSKTVVSICLAGADQKQVESDVKELKLYFDKNDFTAERPGADQLKLYMQHIPGTESYARDFIKQLSPFIIAGGVFGVNNRVGDNVGYYIGTANGKPVYLNIGQASLGDKSPAGTLYGDLGYGKSFNVNMLLFLHVLYGAYGLVICPKGERKHWKSMPLIGEYVNLVELTTDAQNKGKLDPYNMYPDDLDYASELAANIIIELLGLKASGNEYVVLMESIKVVKKSTNPSMLKLVETIESVNKSDAYYEHAVHLSRNLKAIMDSGTSRLLFGDGTEEAININGRLNVIMLQGITFPDEGIPKQDYSPEQRIATVLMFMVFAFSKKFAQMHPGVLKMTVVDESWALKAIPSGSALIDWLARMGRSLYHAILLNGHSVLDLPSEKLRIAMTYKFCFHTSDEDEAVRMLEYLKLDVTKDNINTLMSLRNGECLFSDLYGRVSRLKFDIVFEDLIRFFSTTPEEAPMEQEKPKPKQQPIEKKEKPKPKVKEVAAELKTEPELPRMLNDKTTEHKELSTAIKEQRGEAGGKANDLLTAIDELLEREGKTA